MSGMVEQTLDRNGLHAHFVHIGEVGRSAEPGAVQRADAMLYEALDRASEYKNAGQIEQAGLILSVAVEVFSSHPAVVHDYGALLAEAGQDEEAEVYLRRAFDLLPTHSEVQRSLAQLLLRRRDLAGAEALAQSLLARFPGSTFGLSLASVLAVENGNAERAVVLLDYQRLVQGIRATAPEGYGDIATFNQALVDCLMARGDLRANPADRTTRQGRQSGGLFPASEPPLVALQSMIARAIGAYEAAHPMEEGHPFLGQRPKNCKVHGWCTVLDQGGHQLPHIHPSGWLSGIYYPRLPGLDSAPAHDKRGWLIFGQPSSAFHPQADHPLFEVRPEEGTFVLFPSYLHHGTAPYAEDDQRISIAFDLVPQEG